MGNSLPQCFRSNSQRDRVSLRDIHCAITSFVSNIRFSLRLNV